MSAICSSVSTAEISFTSSVVEVVEDELAVGTIPDSVFALHATKNSNINILFTYKLYNQRMSDSGVSFIDFLTQFIDDTNDKCIPHEKSSHIVSYSV